MSADGQPALCHSQPSPTCIATLLTLLQFKNANFSTWLPPRFFSSCLQIQNDSWLLFMLDCHSPATYCHK